MARSGKTKAKKPIEAYDHKGKKRANNPPVGLVTPQTDEPEPPKKYTYDPHLDPQLVWAGKAERTSFEIPTVSLHVHERIEPRTILEAVRKKNGDGSATQGYLFDAPDENLPLRNALDFYKHPHGWSNRLIAGDSLLVMNSLLEKEGLGGQVQMVYIDPPYGIKYGSNFQPFVIPNSHLSQRASNQSFWLMGQPDVDIRRRDDGLYEVEVRGFDYYNPKTGEIESGDVGRIALWMLDTDYDGRSTYPRQFFFPMAGEGEGWARLAKNLKAEIDPERIEKYRGTVSLPFSAGEHGRVAVKIVDDRGIESLRVLEIPQ